MTPDYWICAECGRQLTAINEGPYVTLPVRTCHLDARAYPVRDGRVEWRSVL